MEKEKHIRLGIDESGYHFEFSSGLKLFLTYEEFEELIEMVGLEAKVQIGSFKTRLK